MNTFDNDDFYAENPPIRWHLERFGVDEQRIRVIEEATPMAQGRMVAALRQRPDVSLEELSRIAEKWRAYERRKGLQYTLTEEEESAVRLFPESLREWFGRNLAESRSKAWYKGMFDRRLIGEVSDWVRRNNLEHRITGFPWTEAVKQSSEWHEALIGKGASRRYIGRNVALSFGDGWTVERITNANDMAVEGTKLSGCQADYGKDVEAGKVVVYSLRDPDNEPHVTMGIKGGNIVQIKGANNAYPRKEFHAHLISFMRELLRNNPGTESTEIVGRHAKTLPQLVIGVSAALGGDLSDVDELIREKIHS